MTLSSGQNVTSPGESGIATSLVLAANRSLEAAWGSDYSASSTSGSADSPWARANASVAYDGYDKYDVLFGGEGSSVNNIFGDLWYFSAGKWYQICYYCGVEARFSMAFTGFTLNYQASVMAFGGGASNQAYIVSDVVYANAGAQQQASMTGYTYYQQMTPDYTQ